MFTATVAASHRPSYRKVSKQDRQTTTKAECVTLRRPDLPARSCRPGFASAHRIYRRLLPTTGHVWCVSGMILTAISAALGPVGLWCIGCRHMPPPMEDTITITATFHALVLCPGGGSTRDAVDAIATHALVHRERRGPVVVSGSVARRCLGFEIL